MTADVQDDKGGMEMGGMGMGKFLRLVFTL